MSLHSPHLPSILQHISQNCNLKTAANMMVAVLGRLSPEQLRQPEVLIEQVGWYGCLCLDWGCNM